MCNREWVPVRCPESSSALATIRISTAGRLTGLSPSALRMYEHLGLVLPFREENGQRLFSQTDVEWILQLRAYFERTSLGPRAVSWLFQWIPLYQLRTKFLPADPCQLEIPQGKVVCWNINADDPEWRKICRSCPAYQHKDLALDFKAFEIKLQTPKEPG